MYVRATIVAFAYNRYFLYTILVAKGLSVMFEIKNIISMSKINTNEILSISSNNVELIGNLMNALLKTADCSI